MSAWFKLPDGEADEEPVVHVCAGPPVCLLQGDAAISACNAGCAFCQHIVCHADGTETTYTGHGNA